MDRIDCGRYVRMGLIAGLVAWFIFIATLAYAAFFVPDAPAQGNQLFAPRWYSGGRFYCRLVAGDRRPGFLRARLYP